MKVDLHTHSNCSDGELSPNELVHAAESAGIDLLAITDHDTVTAFDELADSAKTAVVPGIEVTANWRRLTVHVVGLWVDPSTARLRQLTRAQSVRREQRADRIEQRLRARGLPPLANAAREIAAGGQIGRRHFAEALVRLGHCRNHRSAFRRYLGRGRAGDVRADWPHIDDAIAAITSAGGIAVLAHPHAYRLSRTRLTELCRDFRTTGGTAIELPSARHAPDERRRLTPLAGELDLKGSIGSDFHQPGQPWRQLGAVDALPETVEPVW